MSDTEARLIGGPWRRVGDLWEYPVRMRYSADGRRFSWITEVIWTRTRAPWAEWAVNGQRRRTLCALNLIRWTARIGRCCPWMPSHADVYQECLKVGPPE